MSEYQYFEFQAIDRPLTIKEMENLRRYSTRARITATSFINEYHWGNFKGDADEWMKRYFDAFLHVACWGTHILKLRLPEAVLKYKTVAEYAGGDSFGVARADGRNVLAFWSEQEGGDDWEAPEGQLAALIPVRSELAYGDLRALYLGWLLCVEKGEVDPSCCEPAVPAGLGDLSAALLSLAGFLRIDQDLLAVAAQSSSPIAVRGRRRQEITELIKNLTAKEKDDFLTRLVIGEGATLGAEVSQKLVGADIASRQSAERPCRRRVSELLQAAQEHRRRRVQMASEKAAREKAHRERAEAEARAKYLDRIAPRADSLWQKIEGLITTKQPRSYDKAVEVLVDLKDLAARKGTLVDFRSRLEALFAQHSRKGALLERIRASGVS